jgi:transcriptional regulator with XRE-family HTH domain
MLFGPSLTEFERSIVARNLLAVRTAHRVSQAKFAAQLEISNAAYKNYETGRRDLPLVVAKRLCDLYQLSLDWLVRGVMWQADGVPETGVAPHNLPWASDAAV